MSAREDAGEIPVWDWLEHHYLKGHAVPAWFVEAYEALEASLDSD